MKGMSAITFVVHKKNGDQIKAVVVPCNRSEEARFGLAEVLIIGFFLVAVGGLVWLLVQS